MNQAWLGTIFYFLWLLWIQIFQKPEKWLFRYLFCFRTIPQLLKLSAATINGLGSSRRSETLSYRKFDWMMLELLLIIPKSYPSKRSKNLVNSEFFMRHFSSTISGLQQTVLRNKTYAMQNKRTNVNYWNLLIHYNANFPSFSYSN